MKIKMTTGELLALQSTITKLAMYSLERSSEYAKDGMLTASDLMWRMAALSMMQFFARYTASLRVLTPGKTGLKFDAQTGLAFLACWYATDTTEIEMTPLASAMMNTITERLVKAYGGPVILQK